MPQTDFREKTGRFYNEMNDENYSQKATQEKLNFIADSIGQQPTREALLSPTGILYLLSILQNLELPPEGGPKQENAVQKTSAAFEANTVVQTRHEREKVRIGHIRIPRTPKTRRKVQQTQSRIRGTTKDWFLISQHLSSSNQSIHSQELSGPLDSQRVKFCPKKR